MIYKAYRWTHWFDVVSRVTCPAGHMMATVDMWGDSDLICSHKGADGGEDCQRRIYVAPMLRFRGRPLLWACEVSAAEMKEMKRFNSPDEILAYLGMFNTPKAA